MARSASQSTSRLLLPPVTTIAIHTAALRAISTPEVTDASVGRSPPYAVRPDRVVFAPSATQLGHWNPTAAGRMQSGQMIRSHRWQRMCASRSGCR